MRLAVGGPAALTLHTPSCGPAHVAEMLVRILGHSAAKAAAINSATLSSNSPELALLFVARYPDGQRELFACGMLQKVDHGAHILVLQNKQADVSVHFHLQIRRRERERGMGLIS